MSEAFHSDLPGITLDRIGFSYDQKPILQAVSFHAPKGKTTVLFGPSGAGKTTCLRIIAGFEKPASGTVTLGEQEVFSSKLWIPPRRRGIGFCFQDAALWPALTVRKHLEAAISIPRSHLQSRETRIGELLEIFGLSPLANRLPGQLSGGEKKRLAFARAIADQPSYLLLDEPLSSVEAPLRAHLSRLLAECRRYQSTVVVVTHQLDEMYAMADHLVILSDGRVLREGNPESVTRDPQSLAVAELLGYRNFFPVTVQGREMISPFGNFTGDWLMQGQVLAAYHIEDLLAVPNAAGTGQVVSCRYFGRYFQIQVQWENQQYEATAELPLLPQQRVNLQWLHSPILIPHK